MRVRKTLEHLNQGRNTKGMGEFITRRRRLCVSWPLAQLAQPAGSSPTAIIAPIAPPFDRRDTILIGNSGYVQARTGTAAAFFACKIGDKEFVTDQSPPRSLARSFTQVKMTHWSSPVATQCNAALQRWRQRRIDSNYPQQHDTTLIQHRIQSDGMEWNL